MRLPVVVSNLRQSVVQFYKGLQEVEVVSYLGVGSEDKLAEEADRKVGQQRAIVGGAPSLPFAHKLSSGLDSHICMLTLSLQMHMCANVIFLS
jgi:hypothetical protein